MKDVRLIFEKRGALRFISHLDMNRFFTRLIRKTGLDIWYTEGFNPHPYITFALPLSLGFESSYEIVDFRVNDDEMSFETIEEAFKKVVPTEITVIKAVAPVLKTGKIAFTKYLLEFDDSNTADDFLNFLSSGNISITKKSKRGEIKVIDVSDKIHSFAKADTNSVELVLPAGNDNINPSSLVSSYDEKNNSKTFVKYLRTKILDAECNDFV